MAEVASRSEPRAEQAERACPNCGSAAAATYCPHCGQETSLALPTVRAMLRDAAGRYVALDGRLWRTLFPLLFRPGHLTREYFAGRRRRYIRPARLFLVLSIALFALLRLEGGSGIGDYELVRPTADEIARDVEEAKQEAKDHKGFDIDSDLGVRLDVDAGSWLDPLRLRVDQFNKLSSRGKVEQIFAGMLRYGPYAAFVLLPIFALLLKLLYLGRRRAYPLRPRRYAAHLVFGAHNHAFVFLACIALLAVPWRGARTALVLWMMAYMLWSMKVVYGGRWSGVLARASILSIAYAVFFGIVVACLVVAAVLLK